MKKNYTNRNKIAHHARGNRIVFSLCVLIVFAGLIFVLTRQTAFGVGFRADNLRSGDFSSYNRTFHTIAWYRKKLYGFSTSSPVIDHGVLYIGELYGNALNAYDLVRGTLLWKFKAEDDVPFSPTINQNTVYVTSTDGRLYALDARTGSKKWDFRVDGFSAIATSPLFWKNTVFFGARDSYLYAIDAKTGKQRWRFRTGNYIDSSPILHGDTLFFGDFDGNFYAINAATGKETWRFRTGDRVISSPAEYNGTVYFGSADGNIYALDITKGSLLWNIQTQGSVETTPALFQNMLIGTNRNNTLFAIDTNRKKILWEKQIKTGPYTAVAVKDRIAYVGTTDKQVVAFSITSGEKIWTITADSPVQAAPSIVHNALTFTTYNGYVYVVDRQTGKPFINPVFSVSQNAKSVPAYDIFELTITTDEAPFQYPWKDIGVSAVFTAKHHKMTMKITGFYYDVNTWKLRFTPPVADDWSWSASLTLEPAAVYTRKGHLTAVKPNRQQVGFMQIDPYNEYRFVLSDGSFFHPVGTQTCLTNPEDGSFSLNGLFVDGKSASLDAFLKLFGENGAKFNLYRFGFNNCSFPFWRFSEDERLVEAFPRKEGIWADMVLQAVKRNGFHIWMTILNEGPFAINKPLPKDLSVLNEYLNYISARYGGYVDVWELLNEHSATDEWISYVSAYLKSIDPYKHLITINWERPELSQIDITSPHWYETEPELESDTDTVSQIEKYRWGKPTVFGEQGNQKTNWDEKSGNRMRARLWTSFFNEASLIFWDTSSTKTYYNPQNANIYIGPEERSYTKIFQDFTAGLDPKIRMSASPSLTNGVRSYGLQDADTILGYLFHFSNHSAPIVANIRTPFASFVRPVITWMDPSTGKTLLQEELNPNAIITSPPFIIDIAYKITNKTK